MNFRRGSVGAAARRDDARVEITPLIDVIFLLLIFLLVSTTFKKRRHAFEIPLPKAGVEAVVVETDVATLYVASDGSYAFLDPDDPGRVETVKAAPVLLERVKAYLARHSDAPIRVRADRSTPYQRVVDAMGVARKAGAPSIQLEYEMEGGGGRGSAPGPPSVPAP